MECAGKTVIPISNENFAYYERFAEIVRTVRRRLHVRDRYGEAVVDNRRKTHDELLRIERRQRASDSLCETARWVVLIPRVFRDDDSCP